MSMLETLQAEAKRLEEKHGKASSAFHAARAKRAEAEVEVRKHRETCSEAWNELAAVKASLREMQKHTRPAVNGKGELKAGAAGAEGAK